MAGLTREQIIDRWVDQKMARRMPGVSPRREALQDVVRQIIANGRRYQGDIHAEGVPR